MLTENYLEDVFYISSRKSKALNIFWLGFIIYTFSYVISTTGKLNYVVCQLFQLGGLVAVLYACIFLIRFKIETKGLKTIYYIYYFWLVSVIFRGFLFNYSFIKMTLFKPDGLFLYFVPLIILFPRKLYFYKRIFDVIVICGICFIIYDAIFIRSLLDRYNDLTRDVIENFSSLSLPCGFLLLTYTYHSNKKILLAASVMIFTILVAVYRGRRGLSAIFLMTLLFFYLLYLFNTKRKLLIIYLSVLAMVLASFYVSNVYNLNQNSLFSFLAARKEEDTRTGVELLFYDDMKTKDWIIGKGINGEYFCPNIEEFQLTNYRNYIETGYLQIILKGGIISLGLYLLIAIPAIVLGLFYSKNMLSKASGIWIFIALVSLYPTAVDAFSLQYILVWTSIGICYSKKIRNLPDDTIKEIFADKSL